MVNRYIHRIYFGFDGKPDPYEAYLATWVKEMPGFEIKHWNAENLPINCCFFSKLMYDLKDHAFLSDYFRWWLLREYGGIYLDADIEILSGERLIGLFNELEVESDQYQAIIGVDNKEGGWYTAHSMISVRGSDISRFMCETYEGLGNVSLWRRKIFYFMAPQLSSLYFASNGWNPDGMGTSPYLDLPIVRCKVKILPQDYFSPMTPLVNSDEVGFVVDSFTENTSICHHFSCSWHDQDSPYKATNTRALLNDFAIQGKITKVRSTKTSVTGSYSATQYIVALFKLIKSMPRKINNALINELRSLK